MVLIERRGKVMRRVNTGLRGIKGVEWMTGVSHDTSQLKLSDYRRSLRGENHIIT